MSLIQSELNNSICNQHGCEDEAVMIVYWPDTNPPPKYCLIHAVISVTILNAMGYDVLCRPILENLEPEDATTMETPTEGSPTKLD